MRRIAALVASALVAAGLAAPAAAESTTLFNTTPITFSGTSSANGSPYPSAIQVTGVEGPITDVDLHINAIDVAELQQLQLLLVSPSGDAEIAKAYRCLSQSVGTFQLTFDQQAAAELPQTGCTDGGVYRPTNSCVGQCSFFTEFPGATDANFDNFNNENANGTWRLFA